MSGVEEIFDVVDDQDRVIGQRARSEVHRLGLLHRSVHVLVFNALGQMFLQKRSMHKDENPGVWDASISGHLDSGESYDQCAIRESREELGIVLVVAPQPLFKIEASATTGYEFTWVYRTESEGPFVLQAEEIEGGDWFELDYLSRWSADRPDELAPTLRIILATLGAESNDVTATVSKADE